MPPRPRREVGALRALERRTCSVPCNSTPGTDVVACPPRTRLRLPATHSGSVAHECCFARDAKPGARPTLAAPRAAQGAPALLQVLADRRAVVLFAPGRCAAVAAGAGISPSAAIIACARGGSRLRSASRTLSLVPTGRSPARESRPCTSSIAGAVAAASRRCALRWRRWPAPRRPLMPPLAHWATAPGAGSPTRVACASTGCIGAPTWVGWRKTATSRSRPMTTTRSRARRPCWSRACRSTTTATRRSRCSTDGRIRVFYSAHDGATMYYRTSRAPEDITSWEAPSTIPTNTSGTRGFTYPNPIRLSAERKRYLFWRGGNCNPTFSTQADGESTWSTAANLMLVSGQRPYVKYESNGSTPSASPSPTPIPRPSATSTSTTPTTGRAASTSQRHADRQPRTGDLAQPGRQGLRHRQQGLGPRRGLRRQGRPGHRVRGVPDARATTATCTHAGRARSWSTSQITPAGGSISLDGKEPYYSGGITLDHEDPSTVYLSRDVAGVFQVETWKTTDGGTSWSKQDVSAPDTVNNLRPISPRGLIPFSGDMSVVWMRGIYNSYVDYKTSITTILANGGNRAPIADAERPRSGPAPQGVASTARLQRSRRLRRRPGPGTSATAAGLGFRARATPTPRRAATSRP